MEAQLGECKASFPYKAGRAGPNLSHKISEALYLISEDPLQLSFCDHWTFQRSILICEATWSGSAERTLSWIFEQRTYHASMSWYAFLTGNARLTCPALGYTFLLILLLVRWVTYLQGPTSSGKTTLVSYLAAKTGHRCIRINNHEGTDLQEYLGSYITDEQGRLNFREGAFVTALREGHWIVLDELNLAPSEVLEALNR